jgi:GAF domain-containing protein
MGILVVEVTEANVNFDDQFVRFIQAVADQIAVALQNQILFEQAQQEARQALALAEASQLANQVGGELAESINTMFVRVAETAGYDRWLLMQLNVDGTALELISQNVPNGSDLIVDGRLDLSTANHPIANAVLFNRTLTINDSNTNTALRDNPKLAAAVGKHIATPIVTDDRVLGALIVGRSLDQPDLTERDNTLIDTLAAQVAVTIENQRLFDAAERERLTLRSILDTLPAGVLVLDAETLKPVLFNGQISDYLGSDISLDIAFSAESYNLFRTGTNIH